MEISDRRRRPRARADRSLDGKRRLCSMPFVGGGGCVGVVKAKRCRAASTAKLNQFVRAWRRKWNTLSAGQMRRRPIRQPFVGTCPGDSPFVRCRRRRRSTRCDCGSRLDAAGETRAGPRIAAAGAVIGYERRRRRCHRTVDVSMCCSTTCVDPASTGQCSASSMFS